MAMQSIAGWHSVFQPMSQYNGSGWTGVNATGMQNSGEYYAIIFYWPGGDLTKFAFYCVQASGSCTAIVQICNVDNTNATNPVSTAIGSAVTTATLAVGLVAVTGLNNTSLSAGYYAVKISYNAGTRIRIADGSSSIGDFAGNSAFPYVLTNLGPGTITKQTTGTIIPAIFGDGTAWKSLPGFFVPLLPSGQSFNSGSTPNEYGLWFTNPYPYSIRISGFRFYTSSAPGNFVVSYYTGSLASPTAAYTDTINSNLISGGAGWFDVPFGTKQTLAASTSVGIGIRPSTVTNMAMNYMDFGSGNQSYMDGFWGQNATWFSRTGGSGALTQTTYRTPLLMPFYDGMDYTAGGVFPGRKGMTGGIAA